MALRFVTLEDLQIHCRADGDETDGLSDKGEAAERTAEIKMNRNLYPDADTLASAVSDGLSAIAAAQSAFSAAATAAGSDQIQIALAASARDRAIASAIMAVQGLVITADIKGAILMHAAHLWANRTDAVTGQYGIAVEVPMNSAWIYQKYGLTPGDIYLPTARAPNG